MKNINKGFTLIELLAVIVILAIIALIAIPTVMKVIENSKKGAVERSAENFINAAEQELAKGEMENNPIVDGSYTVTTESASKYIVSDSDSNNKYEVKMNGTMPDDGSKLIISGGKITGLSNFTLDGYTVTLDESKQVVATKTSAKICVPSGGTSSGDFTVGSQYDCTVANDTTYTFYILEVTEDNVSLIMDRNIDNTKIAWSSDRSNHKADSEDMQAVTAKAKLPTTWTNVDKVSLPSYDQIYNVNSSIRFSSSTWLYDYLNGRPHVVAVYGYWTSTPNFSNSNTAWSVDYNGRLYGNVVNDVNNFGVRPVITISKSKI